MSYIASMYGASQEELQRSLDNLSKAPHELTPEEHSNVLKFAHEVSELRTAPPETLSPTLRREFKGPRPYGYPSFVMPPLPPERQTRSREMWDEMHIFLLNPHAELLWYQLKIDELLRNNFEWDPFSLTSFLNHVSEHLTGKARLMMMEEYTQSKTQQAAQLFDLHARKPAVHDDLMHALLHAISEGQPPHGKACTCLYHAHLARVGSLEE